MLCKYAHILNRSHGPARLISISPMFSKTSSRFLLMLNFGLVYVFWGSTYLGIDIAESAIETARSRHGNDARIRFQVGSVAQLPPLSADMVVSLGLFDWLTDEEIATSFRQSGKAEFLHAIAERRPGVQQWLHRSYVQLAYGYRTDQYRPRYLTCEHVRALWAASASRPLYVYRNWRLSFGALLSSLPIGPQV